jgi:hypothetical protein
MKSKQARKIFWPIIIIITLMISVVASLAFLRVNPVKASILENGGPERKATISESYTTYEWWLLSWSSTNVLCQVFVEHEGVPELGEVEHYCGSQLTQHWLNTQPCSFSDEIKRAQECPGLYFHLASVTPGEREIEVDLLPPEVFIDISGCNPQPPENQCDSLPELHFIAEEPLPNESIINIQGYIGSEPFTCQGNECTVPLPVTGFAGVEVTFWAESTFGDSTEIYTAQLRVIAKGDFAAPDGPTQDPPLYYVDILSSQYLGETRSTCSQIWSAFPPIGGPSPWLSSPEHPDGLSSEEPLYYLAGMLISKGLVDVSTCSNGGLEVSRFANQCGLEAARTLINEWQNQFNSEIINASTETGVPAQLLKNIFSKESQFWPGFSPSLDEVGLGHLSDLGADTVLLWNPNFFSQFCPLVLDTSRCQKGFGNLDISEQEMLRGALFQEVNASCLDCPSGIDLRQVNFSIGLFARSLLANCEQVGQIIYNQTQLPAGQVSSYEDLWRFTLVNYNAGPGCLGEAIEKTIDSNYPLTWENMSLFLEPGACQASNGYVEDISSFPSVSTINGLNQSQSLDVPSIPTESLDEITPIEPTPTPVTNINPTPTPTEVGYPIPTPTQSEPYP